MLRFHLSPFDYALLLLLIYWQNLTKFPRLVTFFLCTSLSFTPFNKPKGMLGKFFFIMFE